MDGSQLNFQNTCLVAFIQPIGSTRGLVLISSGKSRKYLVWGFINAICVSMSFVLGIPWGAKGVATAYACANYLILVPSLFYVFQGTLISFMNFIVATYKPFVSSLIMCIICFISLLYIQCLHDIFILIICFAISALVYLATYILISGDLNDIRTYLSYAGFVFAKN